MEWFVQNFELIVYIALLLIITLIIVVIVLSRRLTVFFTNAKFKIQSQYVVDPTTKEKYISLTVYNNNLNDSRMTGFGFIYEKQNIDYYRSYLINQKLDESVKLNIVARDSFTFKINLDDLVTTLMDLNHGKWKATKIQAFITDSLGLMLVAKSSIVRHHVQLKMSELKKAEKERKLLIAREHRSAQRIKSAERKAKRQLARQEWLAKQVFAIKSIFKRK